MVDVIFGLIFEKTNLQNIFIFIMFILRGLTNV